MKTLIQIGLLGLMLPMQTLASDFNSIENNLFKAVQESVEKHYGFPTCTDIDKIGQKFIRAYDKKQNPTSLQSLVGNDVKKLQLTMKWYTPLTQYLSSSKRSVRGLYQWTRKCQDRLRKQYPEKILRAEKKRSQKLRSKSLKEKVDHQYSLYQNNTINSKSEKVAQEDNNQVLQNILNIQKK